MDLEEGLMRHSGGVIAVIGLLLCLIGLIAFLNGTLWYYGVLGGPLLISLGMLKAKDEQKLKARVSKSQAGLERKGFLLSTERFEEGLLNLAKRYPDFFKEELLRPIFRMHKELPPEKGSLEECVPFPGSLLRLEVRIRLKRLEPGRSSILISADPSLLQLVAEAA